ncbi:MAG: DUF4364 family protein [Acutalibacteraceae bacterium]
MENFDAFTAGVEPGGLRTRSDIGILICYMLDAVEKPFCKNDIISVICDNGIANYFETSSAVADLEKCGNIVCMDTETELYTVTDNGKLIANQLHTGLPSVIRKKAVTATLNLLAKRKIEDENPVTIQKAEDGGYNVNFRITDGVRDLMSFTLFVPDLSQANLVKQNFHKNPERIYQIMLAATIGEKEMVQEALRELRK